MKKVLLAGASTAAVYVANTADQIDAERAERIFAPLARYFGMLPS